MKRLFRKDTYTCMNPCIQGIVHSYNSLQPALLSPNASSLGSFATPRAALRASRSTRLASASSYYGSPMVLRSSRHEATPRSAVSNRVRASLHSLKKELEIDDHMIPLSLLLERYKTDPNFGLTSLQVKENAKRFGENVLSPPHRRGKLREFLHHVVQGFSVLLLIGCALCLVAASLRYMEGSWEGVKEHVSVGAVLLAVIFVSALFSYAQETQSQNIVASFKKMVPQLAEVTRAGEVVSIDATELVVGDVILLEAGHKVPADVRLITCHGLKVDNSALTGETIPHERSLDCTSENPFDSKNLCFYSTLVLQGSGIGIVIGVGDKTFMGRLATMASSLQSSETESPIAKEISEFVRMLSRVATIVASLFFAVSVALGSSWLDAAVFLIGIIVANVPEGMVATVTICLALTAKKMARRSCVVKSLQTVETLGCIDCICTEKTAVLTQNKMFVSHIWVDGWSWDFGHAAESAAVQCMKSIKFDLKSQGFTSLVRAAALCNSARIRFGEMQHAEDAKFPGASVDYALVSFAKTFVGHVPMYRKKFEKVNEIPFSFTNRFHATLHILQDGCPNGMLLLVIKGAPELIFEMCTNVKMGNRELQIENEHREAFDSMLTFLCNLGELVVGFCEAYIPYTDPSLPSNILEVENLLELTSQLPHGLTFLGLLSLADPIRPEIPESVAITRRAGIRTILITGDHPLSAKAIAHACGILSDDPSLRSIQSGLFFNADNAYSPHGFPLPKHACIVHGEDLRDIEPQDLDHILKSFTEVIFARTSPEQKLMIVEACQRQGWIVACTGYSVDDAPALAKADVGIAMGNIASDVAKDAADAVLLNGSYFSILVGVEEGRHIFTYLKKTIFYVLTDNMAELAHFFLFLVLQIPLPLGVLGILCIDLGTDIVPAISLVYEEAEEDLMAKEPRRQGKDKLVTGEILSYAYFQIGLIESCAAIFSYIVVMAQNGFLPFDLIGIRDRWDSEAINDLEDSFGQEWTYEQRKRLECTCSTAYFVGIVVAQWSNLLICKTKRVSLFSKGFRNHVLNAALVFETVVACILIYCPGIRYSLELEPLRFEWWMSALPFSLLIIAYDELRQYLVRRYPDSWFSQEFSV